MNELEVKAMVREVAEEVLGDPISEEAWTMSFEDLGIDSLDGLEIFTTAVKKSGLEIPRSALASLKSLADFVSLIVAESAKG